MGKPRMYGYFKPVTPNCRAWCPKKMKPRESKKRKENADAKTVGKQFGPA